MDKLKQYVQDHLEEMDTDLPADKVWQRLEQHKSGATKPGVIKLWWRYAAAACLLALILTSIFYTGSKPASHDVAATTGGDTVHQLVNRFPVRVTTKDTSAGKLLATVPLKSIAANRSFIKKSRPKKGLPVKKSELPSDPALLLIKDIELNYTQLVTHQLARLRKTPVHAESPSYFSTFKQQLKQIEKDETAIKKEIRQQGLSDELLQQLININQQKLNVLKALQAEISKLNNKVRSGENRPDSTSSYYLNL